MKTTSIPEISAQAIREAHARILPFIHHTPVMVNKCINNMVEASVFFKCENMQKVGSFKARGATNAIRSLEPDKSRLGVATHSSGNHAQALSWAASLAGIDAYIVMPSNSNRVKIAAVRDYGGKITFCEPTLRAREKTLAELIHKTGAEEIHPYNDFRIIAGQATAAIEFLEDTAAMDFLMTPVGGGGLLSGTALSCYYFGQDVKVIAAEPEQANDAYLSFIRKEFVPSVSPNTIADGLKTSLGNKTFPVILKYVDQIYTVKEASIIAAMRLIWERLKILVESSAAVPLAVLLENHSELKNKRIGIILSGGNVDLDSLPW